MKRISKDIFLGILFMAAIYPVDCQVLYKASVDRDGILIGEPLVLELELHAPLGVNARFTAPDSIPHFEITHTGELKTNDGVDGKQWSQQVTLTGFDTGRWVIPALPAVVDGKTYYTDSIGVMVSYAPFDASQPYRDIKDIEQVPPPPVNYWLWAGSILLLLFLGLGVYFIWRYRKKKSIVPPPPPLSPFDAAMRELAHLRQKGWEWNGEVKLFYTDLNDIFRVFLSKELRVASLEKTNDEIILQLRTFPLERDKYTKLVEVLRTADFVKFAQYVPKSNENERNFLVIESAIQSLHQNV